MRRPLQHEAGRAGRLGAAQRRPSAAPLAAAAFSFIHLFVSTAGKKLGRRALAEAAMRGEHVHRV